MPASRIPSLRHFKPKNLGFVELNGRRHYLGRWGDPATSEKYHQLLAQWEARGRRVEDEADEDLCIVELVERFTEHAERHYRRPDGRNSSSVATYNAATEHLTKLYGRLPVAEFGPIALRTVRDAMVAAGLARKTANRYVSLIRSVMRWAVAEELVAPAVLEALRALAPLERGRTAAPEVEPVRPAPIAHVEKALVKMSRPVAAMVRLQLLSGARPGEITRLRAIDLETSGPVWTATLAEHKTSWRGRARVLYFGPKAQAIIREFLDGRPVDVPLFDPREGHAESRARAAHCHRRPDQVPTARESRRTIGETYTTNAYGRAVRRACEAANVPTWAPNQLRHTFATAVRREHGLDAAQVLLGHSEADVTQIYAEADVAKAQTIIARIG